MSQVGSHGSALSAALIAASAACFGALKAAIDVVPCGRTPEVVQTSGGEERPRVVAKVDGTGEGEWLDAD
eukprot:7262493-Prymnesium_polylepis.1